MDNPDEPRKVIVIRAASGKERAELSLGEHMGDLSQPVPINVDEVGFMLSLFTFRDFVLPLIRPMLDDYIQGVEKRKPMDRVESVARG